MIISPYNWRPVEVLVDGAWTPGWLIAWQRARARARDRDRGWRGLVQYRLGVGQTYHQWRPAQQIRPGDRPE